MVEALLNAYWWFFWNVSLIELSNGALRRRLVIVMWQVKENEERQVMVVSSKPGETGGVRKLPIKSCTNRRCPEIMA